MYECTSVGVSGNTQQHTDVTLKRIKKETPAKIANRSLTKFTLITDANTPPHAKSAKSYIYIKAHAQKENKRTNYNL